MRIQNIVFPSNDFNPVPDAFIRVSGESNYNVNVKELILQQGAQADFNTYFNSYSLEKWRKYTTIDNVNLHLDLQGAFTVILYNDFRSQNENVRVELSRYEFCSEKLSSLEVALPDYATKGILSFSLISNAKDSTLKGGYYFTTQAIEDFSEAHFAIDICTYKREKYVLRNLDLLAKAVFDEASPLKDSFEIFISDNGKSLKYSGNADKVHIYPNKNAGGAGGFGRGMIEILHSPNFEKFTHIIMMDDDIKFSYETLYRTYVMASTLKAEHRNAFIGGAMLKLNEPQIQSEAMDNWLVGRHSPVKYNYDITDLSDVLRNEIEEKANYFGWWYCAMPIGVIKANNLPLPIFIKRDDIEYGVRNGRTFITLNGICVLHEAFDLKRQGFLAYYYWRNQCILNAIHFPQYSKETLKSQLFYVMIHCVIRYRYNDANIAFVGVEDFLRGVNWLKSTDPEDLNKYVMSYTQRGVDPLTLPINFNYAAYEKTLETEEEIRSAVVGDRTEHMSIKPFLGLFLKANGTRYVKANNPEAYLFYRQSTIVNYDEETNTAFITKKSLRQTYNVYKNYRRICKLIDEKYDGVKAEYKARSKELISLDFWNTHLGLNGTTFKKRDYAADSVIVSEDTLAEEIKAKEIFKNDKKSLIKVRIARFIQRFLFWIPTKRNRISFYLYERNGYTCNIKYIIEELRKQYGKKCEIIFISKTPGSFTELRKKGIKVVRLNSVKHLRYQFTSKVVVTNDSFPAPIILRKGQYTVNTWHAGMNYKKIGPEYCDFRNPAIRKMFYIKNKQPKLYLSGSQFFTDDTSKSFGYNKSVFAATGLPRNDIFFKDNSELNAKIRKYYGIDGDCKLVLFAPTFRAGFREDIYGLDFEKLVSALTARFGGKWVVLYRKHYFVNSKDVILGKNIINVSDYDDMNELLAVSDVLVSDYSSCLWDFALTKRPSFVYAPDLQEYEDNDRSFAYPLEKWPFSISLGNDELERNIADFDSDAYVAKVEGHLKDAKCYDDGQASKRVVALIAKKMKLK